MPKFTPKANEQLGKYEQRNLQEEANELPKLSSKEFNANCENSNRVGLGIPDNEDVSYICGFRLCCYLYQKKKNEVNEL